jgi:hypothetical protein
MESRSYEGSLLRPLQVGGELVDTTGALLTLISEKRYSVGGQILR